MDKEELKYEQDKLDNTIQKVEDQTYYIWELLEQKNNLFRSRTNLAGDEIAYRRGKKDQEILEKAKEEPYFGRFDIFSGEEGEETFYIGKQGIRDKNENLIVVDWRMPIASVYYNFTPGKPKQVYEVEQNNGRVSNKITVEVVRKREFTIIKKKIKKIVQQVAKQDSSQNITLSEEGEEQTINDNFLREILEQGKTTGYLKEIIATIQREQDKAIRQPIDRNVVIQGVAGSGKSSIALHRLSFLLFNNKKLRPESILILGPSKLFISSFKDLLPELDLEGIQQMTFHQLTINSLKSILNNKVDLTYNWYFEDILFNDQQELERKRVEFKGSESLALLLDIFIEEMKSQYEHRFTPIVIFDERLDKEKLKKIFDGYSYLPFGNKVERFIQHVENHFKHIMDQKIVDLTKQYELIVNSFLKNGGITQSEYINLSERIKSIYQFKIRKLKNEFKESFSTWKEKMILPEIVSIYKQVLTFEVLSAFNHEVDKDVPDLFKGYLLKKITYFDLPPLFYIYLLLYDNTYKYTHIVVDEAQDLSYLHFAVLKKLTKTMTILGDKDQCIYMGYGQNDWDNLMDSIFDRERDTVLTLDTSYRSTRQIIEVANTVLKNHNPTSFQKISSVNRKGAPVQFVEVTSGQELIENIISTIREWKVSYRRIAIIHKDEQKAIKLANYLQQEYKSEVVYVHPEKEVTDQSISILTSYYSKGMEFDAVILVNINEENFPKDELYTRLLYVLITRAQKELRVFYQNSPSHLLEGLIQSKPKVVSKFDDIL
ncbi:HelD family protein [Bacillus kexueae]|uniref:HelD family protein n=1 Tax=Aeribacillus kexueae TaxID=2078952 RepID=UPI001FAEC103|nr:3'-5' exonuclease [Bacillus kexueae]